MCLVLPIFHRDSHIHMGRKKKESGQSSEGKKQTKKQVIFQRALYILNQYYILFIFMLLYRKLQTIPQNTVTLLAASTCNYC